MSDYIWEYEAMQEDKERRQKEALKKKKIKQQKLKAQIKEQKRKNRIFRSILLLIIIILILIVPVIKINKVDVDGNQNLSKESIIEDLHYKDKESLLSIFFKKLKFAYSKDLIESISISYNIKDATLTAHIHESTPLSHDNSGNKYISNDGKISKSSQSVVTPLININEQGKIDEINNQLKEIPYDVIIQIQEITIDNQKDDILLLKMADGNKIYIYPEQIGKKVKYYRQMKEILDAKNKGPGNIYLYMGDYYEER